jgi:hypothetical protein
MATIDQNSGYATLINVFIIEPDRRTGFRSANIHVSTDGTRVVNYSAEAYSAMLANPTAQHHMSDAAALAISFDRICTPLNRCTSASASADGPTP